MSRLHNGQQFPSLAVPAVGGGTISLPDEATAAEVVAKHKLAFPVGHSADAEKVAAATGAYVNDDPRYLQSTGFVLAPDGTVLTAVYSSAAIGRLVAVDVAGCRCPGVGPSTMSTVKSRG